MATFKNPDYQDEVKKLIDPICESVVASFTPVLSNHIIGLLGQFCSYLDSISEVISADDVLSIVNFVYSHKPNNSYQIN